LFAEESIATQLRSEENPMNAPTFLDYVTAIGAIATPVLVLVLTGVGWAIRNRFERAYELEEKLRDDRVCVYNEILEPFIILLTKDEAFESKKEYKGKSKIQIATEKIVSLSYRQTAFKLALMGSDDVVKSYNNLMQFFFNQDSEQKTNENTRRMLELLGNFLLEIRKSVGNQKTSLSNLEMLEWLITDIRRFKK
jgi:hypothetical protein